MLLNIKCPPTKQAKSQGNSKGTKTPSGDRMEDKKTLGKNRLSSPLPNKGTVYDSGSITSQIGSEHSEYLSISISLEDEVSEIRRSIRKF